VRTLLFTALCAAACGGAAEPAEPPEQPAPEPIPASAERPPPGSLFRDDVVATVDAGLGRFLQRVEVEASLEQGRFRGFRILELRPPGFWREVDLAPGDVVTSVNGKPIERETQAYDAFQALKSAPELRVSYLRAGKPRELVYRIVERSKAPGSAAP
jgi:S1-C subfamily serine protease